MQLNTEQFLRFTQIWLHNDFQFSAILLFFGKICNFRNCMQTLTCSSLLAFKKVLKKIIIIPPPISRSPLSSVHLFILFSCLFFVYKFANWTTENNTFARQALAFLWCFLPSSSFFCCFAFPPLFSDCLKYIN